MINFCWEEGRLIKVHISLAHTFLVLGTVIYRSNAHKITQKHIHNPLWQTIGGLNVFLLFLVRLSHTSLLNRYNTLNLHQPSLVMM